MKCDNILLIAILFVVIIFFIRPFRNEGYATQAPSECIYIANQRKCPQGSYCMIPGGIAGVCTHDEQGKVWCCPSERPCKFGPCCGKKCTVCVRP